VAGSGGYLAREGLLEEVDADARRRSGSIAVVKGRLRQLLLLVSIVV
jgi:hypothetical protein